MRFFMKKIIFTLVCVGLFSCANTPSNERRVFKYYAIAALFELCDHSVENVCSAVSFKLDKTKVEPEIYYYLNQVMVLFPMADRQNPYVIMEYDKDRYITIINRGTWLSDKKDLIAGFNSEGDFL